MSNSNYYCDSCFKECKYLDHMIIRQCCRVNFIFCTLDCANNFCKEIANIFRENGEAGHDCKSEGLYSIYHPDGDNMCVQLTLDGGVYYPCRILAEAVALYLYDRGHINDFYIQSENEPLDMAKICEYIRPTANIRKLKRELALLRSNQLDTQEKLIQLDKTLSI